MTAARKPTAAQLAVLERLAAGGQLTWVYPFRGHAPHWTLNQKRERGIAAVADALESGGLIVGRRKHWGTVYELTDAGRTALTRP